MTTSSEFQFLTYEEQVRPGIGRIMLDRPEVRNAMNRGMLVELDEAFLRAEQDDGIKVLIIGGLGPVFSSGHDMGSKEGLREFLPGPDQHPTFQGHGGSVGKMHQRYLQEWHFFFDNTRRWRDLRKITVAQVQGPVYAAGLSLMWACDLIVAAEDTTFADVVGSRLGMCGVEYFAHPWEFGLRKAKELLLTGDSLTAKEAYELGMVAKVFSNENLGEMTLDFADRIAERPAFTALMIKEAVNQAADIMGFHNALNAAFNIHQLNHGHWAEMTDGESIMGTPEFGVPDPSLHPPVNPSRMDRP